MCNSNPDLINFLADYLEKKGFKIKSYRTHSWRNTTTANFRISGADDGTVFYIGTVSGSLAVGDSTAKSGELVLTDYHDAGETVEYSAHSFADSGLKSMPIHLHDQVFTWLEVNNGASVGVASSMSFIGYKVEVYI